MDGRSELWAVDSCPKDDTEMCLYFFKVLVY